MGEAMSKGEMAGRDTNLLQNPWFIIPSTIAVLFALACILAFMRSGSGPSCSGANTVAAIKIILERTPIISGYRPLTIKVEGIRTIENLAGNRGHRCRANLSVTSQLFDSRPESGLAGVPLFQSDAIYTVQLTDDGRTYVNIERTR
jgi:hypothetical protein